MANAQDSPLWLLRHGAARQEAEQFIAHAYVKAFGARLTHFMPSLLAYRPPNGRLLGAVGLRTAREQDLFIENYLNRRIEHVIGDHVGPVRRGEIIEIGNFAVAAPSLTFPFFSLIGAWVQQFDFEWIAFVLTRRLAEVFHHCGVPLILLGAAREDLAPNDGNAWGSYYDHDPRLFAVAVRDGLPRFRRLSSRCGLRPAGARTAE